MVQPLLIVATLVAAKIDRRALVERHDVHVSAVDTASPLTVGNGEFAFTADVTGEAQAPLFRFLPRLPCSVFCLLLL